MSPHRRGAKLPWQKPFSRRGADHGKLGRRFALPQTTGPKPPGTELVNRYLRQALLACHTSPAASEQVYRVQNLLASPWSLLRPDRLGRTLVAARRSPALEPAAVEQPEPLVAGAAAG